VPLDSVCLSWIGIYVFIYANVLDVYEIYAASALATPTFARFIFAGGMSIASMPLWTNLGTYWACMLLGCFASLMAPVPFVFYKWGPILRDGAQSESQEGAT